MTAEQALTKIAVFKGQPVRKTLHNNEWWFSIIDVIAVLTDSDNPRDYWYKMKIREKDEAQIELSTICRQLKLASSDGKKYLTDCASTEGVFRIVQSIPSPKAEPFKRWLARVGYERIQEIEDPELAVKRAKETYEKKGYPKDWIEKRMRGIAVRHKLTDEWNQRGVKAQNQYAILTNEIMQGAFEMKVEDYKKFKGLERENLRDHMTDMELILTMLGEATTTQITDVRDSSGFEELQKDAQEGGGVAGRTRKDIEQRTAKKVVSKDNYLPGSWNKKLPKA